MLASVVEGEFTDEALEERQNHIRAWHHIVSEMRLKALPVTTVATTLTQGVRHAVLLSGLGPVRPNIAVVPFISDSADISPHDFISLLRVRCPRPARVLFPPEAVCSPHLFPLAPTPTPPPSQELTMTDMHLSLCCNFNENMTDQIMSYRNFMRRSRGRLASGSDGPSYMTVRGASLFIGKNQRPCACGRRASPSTTCLKSPPISCSGRYSGVSAAVRCGAIRNSLAYVRHVCPYEHSARKVSAMRREGIRARRRPDLTLLLVFSQHAAHEQLLGQKYAFADRRLCQR